MDINIISGVAPLLSDTGTALASGTTDSGDSLFQTMITRMLREKSASAEKEGSTTGSELEMNSGTDDEETSEAINLNQIIAQFMMQKNGQPYEKEQALQMLAENDNQIGSDLPDDPSDSGEVSALSIDAIVAAMGNMGTISTTEDRSGEALKPQVTQSDSVLSLSAAPFPTANVSGAIVQYADEGLDAADSEQNGIAPMNEQRFGGPVQESAALTAKATQEKEFPSADQFRFSEIQASGEQHIFTAGMTNRNDTFVEPNSVNLYVEAEGGKSRAESELVSQTNGLSEIENLSEADRAEAGNLTEKTEGSSLESETSADSLETTSSMEYQNVFHSSVQTERLSDTSNLTNASKPEAYSQIRDEILTNLVAKGSNEFKMQLQPEELGTIDVSLKLNDGKLVIDILAQNANTQTLLISQVDKLISSMGLQNVQVESVQVSQQMNQNSQNQSDQNQGYQQMQSGMDFSQGRKDSGESEANHRVLSTGIFGRSVEYSPDIESTQSVQASRLRKLDYVI